MHNNKTICLNMIVKNEAHIIASTLENLCQSIDFDYWVIVDTGSTDDTRQIISDFFKDRNIKGELHETEWKNFGFNRSDALSKAFNKTDYLLIFDADDRIVGDFVLPKELNLDGYHLKFGDNVSYVRLLLVNNALRWKFMGVLHEYIICTNENYSCKYENIEGNYHLISGKSGARSKNPNKYRDDALILETAYDEAVKLKDDIMVRYSFYCAQSYKDAGNDEISIEWYKKRISHGGWNQEVYYSYITIGQLYAKMNNIESAFYYWTLSFDADPERCEGIYYIIKHCRENGKFQLALHYYKWIEKNKTRNLLDKLFVTEDVYKYLLDYEFTIIACYVNQHKLAITSFHTLFKYANALSSSLKENIVSNLQFYIKFIDSENLSFFYDYLAFVKQIYLETGSLKKHIVDIVDKMKDKFEPLLSPSDSSNDTQLHDGVDLDASITIMEELLKKYDCYPGQDFFGSDILHIRNKSLFDQLLTAEKMSDCACFNTLGYFKKEMDINRMNNLNICNLYVKKKYLLEKKSSCCNKIKENINKCKKYKSSKKILFYVGYSGPEYRWNKTLSLTTPTGGSEKALSYLIEKFPKNYDIYVCGDVIEEEYDNIHFVNFSKIKNIVEENEFHTVILSRYIEFIVNYKIKCYKLYIWAHDTCIRSLSEKNNDANEVIKNCIYKIDGCICLTNWHKEYISSIYNVLENKIFIINNGIELMHFPEPHPKIKNTFVYTSRSERGLQRVLELWESISKNIINAHLSISSYNAFPDPNNKNDFILEREIKKYSNIDHLGKLNEKELYDLMNKSEFWIYPTNFFETSCITAMEMLKSRVICLYYPIGGLVDTINGNGIQLIRDEEVNQIINLTEDEKQTIIEKGERYANDCSWENRYKEWESQLFCVEHVNENINNKIKVVNLLRRTDRRDSSVENFKRANITNYEFVEAVDGKVLTPNSELISLFKGNDFGNRRGVIGCALTHYNLWKKLLESEYEYFIIMEDDFTIIESFKEEIEKIDFEKYDILLMGYHMFSKTLENVKHIYRNLNENEDVNLTIDRLQMDYFVGGTHCYSINKNGARKLLDYINKNGIKRAIDCLFKIPELECFETRPHISFAEWNEGGKVIDSDIQNMCDSIDLSDTPDGLLQKYDYYHTGNRFKTTTLRNIFIYWVGYEYKLIKILRRIMELNSTKDGGYNLVFINEKNKHDYVDVPDYFGKLCPAHQADYIRVNVLCEFGGIWLDSDTIVMDSLDTLFDILEKKDGFFIKQNNESISNGIFGTKPNTTLMKSWKEDIKNILETKCENIEWEEIGNKYLQYKYETTDYFNNYEIFNGLDTVYPVNWNYCYTEFLNKPYDNYKNLIREYQPFIVLVNSVYKAYESMELVTVSNTPLQYFIDKSFENMTHLIDYKFVEIGTSNFDTLIETASENDYGLSIEPLSMYLDQLPSKKNVKKMNMAVTDVAKTKNINMYYIPESVIKENNLPEWFKGCNTISDYHPLHKKHNVEKFVRVDTVELISVDKLFYLNNIKGVEYIKIDTEGHDCIILRGLYEYLRYLPDNFHPKKIKFESNENTKSDVIDSIISLYKSLDYYLVTRGYDTVLKK